MRNTAKFAVLFPAGVLYLKLLGLMHPSKPLVDAVFHAHRFDAVLAGRFYFTQLSTSATPFPYAIGLYLFAAPWSFLTADHVALLRIVVCACEAIAGGLLYVMIDRVWGDRLTAAVAVALVSLVPVAYPVVGNANLTYAFGQTVALATIATATAWPLQPGRFWRLAAVILLATLGFISHISTLLLLLGALTALALHYWLLGSEELRTSSRRVVVATALAVVAAVALYWGHFPDVYKAQLTRTRTVAAVSRDDGQRESASLPPSGQRGTAALGRMTIPLAGRVLDAGAQTVSNLGWPLLILAVLGAWRLVAERRRDRVALAVAAWTLVGAVFVAGSVLTAVDKRYQQDAWEFIGRVEHTTAPAVVILAAVGAIWAWRDRTWTRIASSLLMAWAVVLAIRWWTVWF